jgi:hypothetical protein
MSASLTHELRRLMRHRPVTERVRLWWLLRRLNHLEYKLETTLVGGAGFALSNHLNGGRCDAIRSKIIRVEDQIRAITQPVMNGKAA